MIFNPVNESAKSFIELVKELCEGKPTVVLEDVGDGETGVILEAKIGTNDLDPKILKDDKSLKKRPGSKRVILLGRDIGTHPAARMKVSKSIPATKNINTREHLAMITIYEKSKGEIVAEGDGLKYFTSKELEIYKELFKRNKDIIQQNKDGDITEEELEKLFLEREGKN